MSTSAIRLIVPSRAAVQSPAAGNGTTRQSLKAVCSKCEASEFRRLTRSLVDRAFARQPYQCHRCKNVTRRFRGGWSLVIPALWLGGVAAIAGVVTYPASFHLKDGAAVQSEVEALSKARTSAGGQLSTFEQMMTKKPRRTLDNATILKLWRAKVGTSVILQMIRTSDADYDLGASSVIELRSAEVDQSIVLAMIDASYVTR